MGIRGKLEVEVDIKSSGDLFHELWGNKPHHISNIIPHSIHACELHEGDYGQHGSVVNWHYTIKGTKYTAKQIIEKDEANKKVTFNIIGGELTEVFKNPVANCQVIPNGEITTVKWDFIFEKINDDGPYPTDIMDFLIGVTKDIEAHHLKP